ncbi:hypothetical protein Tco_0667258 [Tanacetum coccineum]
MLTCQRTSHVRSHHQNSGEVGVSKDMSGDEGLSSGGTKLISIFITTEVILPSPSGPRKFTSIVVLTNNFLDILTRYLEQMRSHGLEMLLVESLRADLLISYGLHTLQRVIRKDMRNSGNLVAARNDLLRTIA